MNGIRCIGKSRPQASIDAFLASLRWSIIQEYKKREDLSAPNVPMVIFSSIKVVVGKGEARVKGVVR